jgi:adenylosuccinate synthase
MFKDILEDNDILKSYLWDEYLHGDVLCEGAQGFWLDINYGNYPYITSSTTLPYSACSLGFPPQRIRDIYGAAKIYDTRVGIDPDFPDSLLEDKILNEIALVGNEFGTTTGRARKVNWLDTDRLIKAINISGCTHIIISKTDVLEKVGRFRILNSDMEYRDLDELQKVINEILIPSCPLLKRIVYSNSAEGIEDL